MDKRILEEYEFIKKEVEDLNIRIKRQERDIAKLENDYVADTVSCGKKGKKSLRTVKISGMPQGIIAKKQQLLMDRKERLEKKEEKLMEMIASVEDYINGIGSSEFRMLFRFYYIDGLTWQQVAVKMNSIFPRRQYTADSCRMKHDRFLKKH